MREAVEAQAASLEWGGYARALLHGDGGGLPRLTRPRAGHDAGDHPPITPCRCVASEEEARALGGDGQRLFGLIGRHFLASVSPDARATVRATTAFTTRRSHQSLEALLGPAGGFHGGAAEGGGTAGQNV